MKKITVISGKGGTGKTSLVASFAVLAGQKAVLVDGDVDAANLSLITRAEPLEEHDFTASKIAVIDPEKCEQCELCRELCRFEAVTDDFTINHVACEGCGLCAYACPHQAVEMVEKISGRWFVSRTPYGKLIHARLGIAEENSGKLVTIVRNKGEEVAEAESRDILLIDGPPGIGCPVIASLTGVDVALVVAEPTVSGIHDLERVIAVCRHFAVNAAVCINRFDINENMAGRIEQYCFKNGVLLAGKVPYDKIFVEAVVNGIPVVEYNGAAIKRRIEKIWNHII